MRSTCVGVKIRRKRAYLVTNLFRSSLDSLCDRSRFSRHCFKLRV